MNSLQSTIDALNKHAKKSKLWARVSLDLQRSARRRRTVNVAKIAKVTKKDEAIVVPGKVLGNGIITHPVTVIAYQFSEGATQKITQAGGKTQTIAQSYTQTIPKLRIIG